MKLDFVESLKKQWMAMIDAIDDPLVLLTPQLEIVRLNKAYKNSGLKTSDIPLTKFKNEKCYAVFADRKDPCPGCPLKDSLPLTEKKVWKSDQIVANRTLEVQMYPLELDDEESYIVVHYRDLTEHEKLYESLAQADKLAALGKLAGGVAHEINSPLAGILAFTQMLLKEMPSQDQHYDDLLQIEEAAKRCKSIIEHLLNFARQDSIDRMVPVDVAHCVASTLQIANALLRKNNINVVHEGPVFHSPLLVLGHPGKLGQVFLNLLTNSIYAMKECDSTSISIRYEIKNQNIHIHFSDTGVGIPQAFISKIFDPFFTTKPIGEGTGLGLSLAYSIIKAHKGSIEVQSIPDNGTTFTIILPLVMNHEEEMHRHVNH